MNQFELGMHTLPPFPINALPPSLYQAALEAKSIVKAPVEIIAASLLSTLSLACQSLISVKRFNGFVTPVSLYFITIAESGERKTTADNLITKPITNFQKKKLQEFQELNRQMLEEWSLWNLKNRALKKSYQKAIAKGGGELELAALKKSNADEPQKSIQVPKYIYSDTSNEALMEGLSQWSSGGLFANEGGIILGNRTQMNFAVLNALWEGAHVSVDRKSTDSFILENAHLTTNIMIQPKTFGKVLAQKGDVLRDNGFLARCLFAYPISTQGIRFEYGFTNEPVALQRFHERIEQILEKSISPKFELEKDKIVLEFSYEAKEECLIFTNNTESMLSASNYLSDIKDFASKGGDIVARIAALFHYFEGHEGSISLHTTNQAVSIVTWYGEVFKKLFGLQLEVPQEIQDANLLENWLFDMLKRNPPGTNSVLRSMLSKYGPNSIRVNPRLQNAINILVSQGKVTEYQVKRTKWVQLGNYFFQPALGLSKNLF